MKHKAKKLALGVVTSAMMLPFMVSSVLAEGQVIQVGTVDNLLWSIVKTIQFYTVPIMAISLAFFGIKMAMSDGDSGQKENAKGWMIKILIGAAIVFSATTIAQIIKTAVGG